MKRGEKIAGTQPTFMNEAKVVWLGRRVHPPPTRTTSTNVAGVIPDQVRYVRVRAVLQEAGGIKMCWSFIRRVLILPGS